MSTSGSALAPTGDVFNGKTYISWSLVSQNITEGGHGSSTISWFWSTQWVSGDLCHTILGGQVTINGSTVYGPAGTVHAFNSGHNHTGIWPPAGWASGTFKIFHDANGQANVVMSATAHGTSGGNSVASGTWALPDIIQAPFAPTGVAASRVSDSQVSLSWTNDTTNHHGYYGIDLYRSTDDGGYAHIAVVVPGTTSYADTTVSANHKYTYKVEGFNDAGRTASSPSSPVGTTPGAPTACAAAKLPNNDVLVSWTNNVNYSEYTTRIEESTDGGSNWAEISSVVAGVTSVEVSASTATTHIYRVRSQTNSGPPLLNSAYSNNSNTVTLLANANAPTGLSPSGVARDATGAIVLSWVHNPADGTPQSKYQLQYKVDAGSFVTVGPTTSGTSSYTLPANTVTNGHTITWHVKTAGQNGTLGSYSADASFTTSAKPTATISTPGATYDSSHLTVTWTYFQAQGSPQATYLAQLFDAANVLIEQVTGTTAASAVFTATLTDGAFYTVKVTVTSAAGLDSAVASQAFSVAFLPPALVSIAAAYDAETASMILTVIGEDAVAGVTEAIDHVSIQRQINGGPWVTFATEIVLTPVDIGQAAVVLDTTPTIRGTNTYRVIGYSALPSSRTSAPATLATAETEWAFANFGPGFAQRCRLCSSLALPRGVGRARARHHFAGRKLPVQFTGTAVDRVTSVSAMLLDGASTVDEFEALGETDGVVCWRDPTGRRIFASIGQVKPAQDTSMPILADGRVGASVSFDLTEIDYSEGA